MDSDLAHALHACMDAMGAPQPQPCDDGAVLLRLPENLVVRAEAPSHGRLVFRASPGWGPLRSGTGHEDDDDHPPRALAFEEAAGWRVRLDIEPGSRLAVLSLAMNWQDGSHETIASALEEFRSLYETWEWILEAGEER